MGHVVRRARLLRHISQKQPAYFWASHVCNTLEVAGRLREWTSKWTTEVIKRQGVEETLAIGAASTGAVFYNEGVFDLDAPGS